MKLVSRAQISGVNACAAGTVLILLVVFATILKFLLSVNLPNRWSITQLVCTYQDGCLKRGLIGAILWPLRHWDGANMYSLLVDLSWLSSLSVALILFVSTTVNFLVFNHQRAAPPNLISSFALGLIPLSIIISPSLQFFFHQAGYLDAFALAVLIAGWFLSNSFSYRSNSNKAFSVALVVIPAVLSIAIHEMSTIAFLPLYFLLSFMLLRERKIIGEKSTKFLFFVAFLLSAIAALLAVVSITLLQPLLGLPSAEDWIINHQALAQVFEPRKDYFEVTSFSNSAKLTRLALANRSSLYPIILGIAHSATFAATLVLALACINDGLASKGLTARTQHYSVNTRQQPVEAKWLFLCALSPVVLTLFGLDFYRWGSLLAIAFASLLASPQGFRIVVNSPIVNVRSIHYSWQLGIIVFCIGILMVPPLLFDGKRPYAPQEIVKIEYINLRLYELFRVYHCRLSPTKSCIEMLSETWDLKRS